MKIVRFQKDYPQWNPQGVVIGIFFEKDKITKYFECKISFKEIHRLCLRKDTDLLEHAKSIVCPRFDDYYTKCISKKN